MFGIREGENTAFIYRGEKISYNQLRENISKLSSLLKINQEDRVIILSENSPYWVCALFAVWCKGGIAVPVDFMSSREDIEYFLQDCKPSMVITSKDRYQIVRGIDGLPETLVVDGLDFNNLTPFECKNSFSGDRTALILYTSGTTGKPKGVVLSFDNLLSNIESVEKVGIATSRDKTLAILPFHHSYPLMVSLLIPLRLGATVVFLDKLTPEDILKKFQDYEISILVGVPRLYSLFHRRIFDRINSNKLLKTIYRVVKLTGSQGVGRFVFKKVHQQFGGNVKYFVSGGSKLDLDVAKDLWTLGFKVVEGYGLTETSPIVSFNPPDKIKLGSVGKVIEGVEVKIKDGEILVKGRNVFKGYYNRPEETSEAFEDGFFRTGDLGYIDEEGYLYITGRKKEIIVLPNGKNVNPEEIENQILKEFPIVKEVAIVQRNGQLFAILYPDYEVVKRERIVNLYQTIKWNVVDKYNLKAVPYKKINGFTIVNRELPKTRLGKIRRFMLDQFLVKEQETRQVSEPEDDLYQQIKTYLKNYTGVTPYPDSHIEIDLGLDSLGKVEFITFLESSFGLEIPEDFLLDNPTVEKVYLSIKDKVSKVEVSEVDWSKILNQDVKVEFCENCLTLYMKPLLKMVFKLYNRLSVKGLENIPTSPVIFAPNHQSYLDGFLLTASLPSNVLKKTYFLAEESYFQSTLRRFIARKSGIVLVNINRNLRESLLRSATVLKRGKNIVIFPEGARTRDGTLLEFRKSFAILSKELSVPVIPVVIKGAFESLPIHATIPKPSTISVEFLKPVYPEGKDYNQIVMEVYNLIRDRIE